MVTASRTRRRGAAIVYTCIVIFVVIGFVGLAVDWGYMTWTAQKLQTAADSAALAGAQKVWDSHSDARVAAINLANLNEAGGKTVMLTDNPTNDPNGDVVIGEYDSVNKTFTPTTDSKVANAVRVRARRTTGSAGGGLGLFFGPIFGKSTAEVARFGTAVAEGGPADTSVIALNDEDDRSFFVYGHGTMDLGDGAAQVNSSDGAGAVFQGTNITFVAGEVNMVGAWDEKGNPNLNAVDLNAGEPYVNDPLAQLPEPVPGPAMVPDSIDPTSSVLATYEPGYYPKGLHLNNGENVFLNPGVYILEAPRATDPSFEINGHATLTGYGVMFFIRTGSVKHNGTGEVHLTPPDSGVYQGIQFFQARNNTQMAVFNGGDVFTGASADINNGAGTLYFPVAPIELGGDGNMFVDSIIADKITVYGNGTKTVTKGYEGNDGGGKVWLVE